MDSPRATLSGIVVSPFSVAEDGAMNRKRISVDLAKSVFQVAESVVPEKSAGGCGRTERNLPLILRHFRSRWN